MQNLSANQMDSLGLSLTQPEGREWLAGRIATLLSHYWRDNDDPALVHAMAKDWLDVLGGMRQAAVQRACLEYLRTEPRRKPTPGAILELAKSHMPRLEVVPEEPEAEWVKPTPEQIDRRDDILRKHFPAALPKHVEGSA